MATSTPITPTSTSVASSPSCTTAVPGKFGYVPESACNSNYNYDPSYSAAVAVAVIFGILTIAHIAEAIIFKKRYAWVLIMGALWETLAFIMGALGAHDQQNSGYATAHTLLFLLAPLWVNAFIYMTFARMVYYFLPNKKVWIFKATGMSKWFVWADILSFIVQATGGLMSSPGGSSGTIQVGLHIYTGGIAMQEFFILCFLGLMIVFHREARQLETYMQVEPENFSDSKVSKRWKGLLCNLYAVLAFISVSIWTPSQPVSQSKVNRTQLRIIYRIAEFGGGISPASNPIPFHEAYSYALDAFPMMLCLLLLTILHPGRSLVGPESKLPRKARAQKKAEKKMKKEMTKMAENGSSDSVAVQDNTR